MPGVLYGAKAEYDLAKTQNSWVNNKEENLFMCVKIKFNANSVCLCALFGGVPYCLEEK